MRIAVLSTVLSLSLGFSAAIQAEPDFPKLTGRVVDNANLLDATEEVALTSELEAHESATSNQIVVVSLPSLQGYSVSEFANLLARHWKIGQAQTNNGVLMLIAPEERKVRIEVGYGLEGVLTDATSADIIRRQILPQFRENDYATGIKSGVKSILNAVDGEYVVEPNMHNRDKGLTRYFPLLFIALIALFEILKRFGFAKLGNSAFPTAIIGIAVTAITSNLLYGALAAVIAFALFFFVIKPGRGSRSPHRHHHQRDNDDHSGGSSGGGFSGGGGSFGGGGASGSW